MLQAEVAELAVLDHIVQQQAEMGQIHHTGIPAELVGPGLADK
jgi:hypothetical protein